MQLQNEPPYSGTEMVLAAARFAAVAHGDQTRRHTGEPYIVHPMSVAMSVSRYTTSPQILAAAMLHDVLEDSTVQAAALLKLFGPEVTRMVTELTDLPKATGMNRAQRKEADAERLQSASDGAQLIKAFDIMDNLPTIKAFEPEFYEVYLLEKRRTYHSLLKLPLPVREKLAGALWENPEEAGVY
jgi:(p)ppGpp synthase/HD superfamily hydrolase